MRRAVVLGIGSILVASACGGGGARGADARDVVAALDRTRESSRVFHFVDEALDGTERIEIAGEVSDDLRYSGTVSIDGVPVFEQMVSDDSVAIRLLDLERTRPAIEAAEGADPVTAQALRSGRWVIDHTVAPPLTALGAVPDEDLTADDPTAGTRQLAAVGDDPFAEAAQLINYAERIVRGGFGVGRFNPEDLEYNVLDDPWASDKDAKLEDDGIRRYDLVLPPLPRPAERGQQQAMPTVQHFRKMAVYVKGERVERVREQIAIGDRREFRRAEAGRTARFYLELRDRARLGGVQGTFRERQMRYQVERFTDVDVVLPDDAVPGILSQVLPALKQLYGFEFIQGGAAMDGAGRGVPPLPTQTPEADTAGPGGNV